MKGLELDRLVRIITAPVEWEWIRANIEIEQCIQKLSREIAGEICAVMEVRHPRGRCYANPARVTVEIIIAEALRKGVRK